METLLTWPSLLKYFFYVSVKVFVHLFLIGLPLCIDTEDIQVIRTVSNASHITRRGLIDGITKRITTRSVTYLTKMDQVQGITKIITGGNRLYSTRMDQTANITKYLTASEIPFSTMTGQNESSKTILVKEFIFILIFVMLF